MRTIIARFRKDISGATAIEYGLIAGLISVVIIAGVTVAGDEIAALFTTISGSLTGVGTGV